MKTINLCKFEPLAGDVPEPVTIVIDSDIPEHKTLDDTEKFFDGQAQMLVDALYNALPQGTFDRVALLMFAKKIEYQLYHGKTDG